MKRGMNDKVFFFNIVIIFFEGYTANHVETEQIIVDISKNYTS